MMGSLLGRLAEWRQQYGIHGWKKWPRGILASFGGGL